MLDKLIYKTRFLEIVPGTLSWFVLIVPIVVSAFKPAWIACFVIAFDFYWLVKAVVFGVHLISGYLKVRRNTHINWMERLDKLTKNPQKYLESLENQIKYAHKLHKNILAREIREVKKTIEVGFLDWREIYNVVIMPTYKEPIDTLIASIESYRKADFPNDRVIIVVAMEEGEGEAIYEKARILEAKFKSKFKDILFTFHPKIEGELQGKGSNMHWAGKKLEEYLKKEKINFQNVIVSAFDCDTRVHPYYFSTLTYKYIINPNRLFRSFQPIPLYSNNIWQAPSINRLVAFSSSFWQMIESTRPYRMVNFSSQAMGMETLKEIDYWDNTIVSEDSRQYYRAFFKFSGNHQVVPVFCPVYMDAVLGDTLWESLVNQYKQKRRWAWGIEHFPYFIRQARKHPEISPWDKFIQIVRMLEGHINWATASLLIAFTIWYPFMFHPEFSNDVLGYNLPVFARYLLMLTWFGIIISATISVLLLPQRPKKSSRFRYLEVVLGWCLIPIAAVFFGSIPAIDAQTRLLNGKYLGFWVTPKEVQGASAKK